MRKRHPNRHGFSWQKLWWPLPNRSIFFLLLRVEEIVTSNLAAKAERNRILLLLFLTLNAEASLDIQLLGREGGGVGVRGAMNHYRAGVSGLSAIAVKSIASFSSYVDPVCGAKAETCKRSRRDISTVDMIGVASVCS